MTSGVPTSEDRAVHWNSIYQTNDGVGASWVQTAPDISLELIDELDVIKDARVLDVGEGASVLVDFLLARGFTDVTVLDISSRALGASKERLGADVRVRWICEDLLEWRPSRTYDLWHDRAMFHFLSPDEVEIYRRLLLTTVERNGCVIIATFAPDGPERCSGLPVTRCDADELAGMLGDEFTLVERRREVHTTPEGVLQPFTWIAARRARD